MQFNPANTLKNSFINFVRYFYDDRIGYTTDLTRKWIKFIIPFLITIFFTGFVFYLFFSGLVFIFPKLSPYIFTGSEYWHIPIIIFYLGLIRWYGEDLYKFIRGKK